MLKTSGLKQTRQMKSSITDENPPMISEQPLAFVWKSLCVGHVFFLEIFLFWKHFVLEESNLDPSSLRRSPPHTRRGPLKRGGDQTCRGHVSIPPALHHKATGTGHHLTRIRLTPIGSTLNFEHDPSHKFAHAWGMFGGTPFRTTLTTILITGLRMSNLCAEAVHCIHLCNRNVRNQSKRKP